MNKFPEKQNKEYTDWLIKLKQKFKQAQIKAAVRVNTTFLRFYWDLGVGIVEKQKKTNWGESFIKKLSRDLRTEFPDKNRKRQPYYWVAYL